MMDDFNPYAGPATDPEPVRYETDTVSGVVGQAWQIFTGHFLVIAAIVTTIWLPLELFSSYMDYFVFDPADFRSSVRLAQFLDHFIGIVATAGVISVGATATSAGVPGWRKGLAQGLMAWPRIWWTRLLCALVTIVCLLLLVIPGIYVAVRLSVAESVAVVERVSGNVAMERSFELTRNKFWFLFRLCIVVVLLMVGLLVLAIAPVLFLPAFDNWIVDAGSQLVIDIFAAFVTLCFFCAYRGLSLQAEQQP